MRKFITPFIKIFSFPKAMMALGKNIGLLLLSMTVIFAGSTFAMALDVDESPKSDDGSITGVMTLTVIDENGYVKQYSQSDNHIVENGMTILAQETFGTAPLTGGIGTSSGPVSHMAIGTDGTGSAAGNTGVTAITGCARLPATITATAATTAATFAEIVVSTTATFDGGTIGTSCSAAADITEAGMFNSLGAGEMFARNTGFAAVTTLGSTDTLKIDWDFTFTDS